MNNIEEMFNNRDFINNLAESLEDIPQDSSAKYALWVIGLDEENDPMYDLFIYEFDTPEEAVNKAKDLNLKFIEEQIEQPILFFCDNNNIDHFSIEVETVVPDPDEEGSTMNIGTIYRRELCLEEDFGDLGLGDYSNVVCITKKDFELLEDGTLKVSCGLLRDFNKNDYVLFEFVDEETPSVLEYKIVSKVIYSDGDYYHCELNI